MQVVNHDATFTPEWLARDMVALAGVKGGDRVLEPSAGRGAIMFELVRETMFVDAYELNERLCDDLNRSQNEVYVERKDFFNVEPIAGYDKVVMNPPMKIPEEHVIHAMKFVKDGGRLVALLHRPIAEKLANFFRNAHLYHIPSNTFRHNNEWIEASIYVWDNLD